MCRGRSAPSIHTEIGMQRGPVERTPPDQNVTASPSTVLPEASPRLQAMKVTTRCASRTPTSPCGSGPYPSAANFRVLFERASVTR